MTQLGDILDLFMLFTETHMQVGIQYGLLTTINEK